MNSSAAMVEVRITADGACFIDDEFFPLPPGALLNESVLSHLQLEAAALGAPVRAFIRDDQSRYTAAIQVNSDGTSHPLHDNSLSSHTAPQNASPVATSPAPLPWDEPLPADRPYEPLPEPYRTRLEAICATARQNHFRKAAAEADQLLGDITTQYGAAHLYTLAAGSVRGDIAWLMRDHQSALQIWAFIAKSWNELLGPTHKTTVRAVGNAVGCWWRLPQHQSLASGAEITALLQGIPIPQAETVIEAIRRRLRGLPSAH